MPNYILILCVINISLFSTGCQQSSTNLMVCASDQRFILTNGADKIADNPGNGALTFLDFSTFPPKAEHLEGVRCSVIGPPTCVAITPDESIALVTAAMKVDQENKNRQIPDNKLTVVNLKSKKPEIIKILTVGKQPSGISISRDGKLALVANRADGTITMLEINGQKVKPTNTIKVCQPSESIAHIAISPDKKTAIASLFNTNNVIVMKIKSNSLEPFETLETGKSPYCIDFTPDGKLALVANAFNSSVSVISLSNNKAEVTDKVYIGGNVPEGLDISSDGKYAAVNCLHNTNKSPDDPKREENGLLVILKRNNNQFRVIDSLTIDRIPQSAVFTRDCKYIAIGSNEFHHIAIYKFENEKVIDTSLRIKTPGGPAALRIADK
jgi:DNA-binding beta-propeller fold protein YncE